MVFKWVEVDRSSSTPLNTKFFWWVDLERVVFPLFIIFHLLVVTPEVRVSFRTTADSSKCKQGLREGSL